MVVLPWVKKYVPKTTKEFVGQKQAVSTLKDFVENFKEQSRKIAVCYGGVGCGKTSLIYALAEELNYELLELNASDFRNKEHVNAIVGNASSQLSLFGKGKIILVDEIEGLSGMKDRGGLQALTALIDSTSFPIICTTENPFDRKFNTLRKKSLLVEMELLGYNEVFEILKNICKNEKVEFNEADLKMLARISAGDVRAAINDLQIIVASDNKLSKENLDLLGDRLKKESILQALVKIFKTTDLSVAINALDNVNESLDESMLWIEENIPYEYKKPKDLERAYNFLSKADVFRRRIRRWQHWRFLVYINALITAGVASSKEEKYKEFFKYKQTGRLLKLYFAKMRFAKRKAIAEKLAEKTHTSTKRVIKDTLPYLQAIFKKNKQQSDLIAEDLELDKEEVAWLRK